METIDDNSAVYEYQIQDMLNMFQSYLEEFTQLEKERKLTEFESGEQLAFYLMLETLKTRYSIIQDILSDD